MQDPSPTPCLMLHTKSIEVKDRIDREKAAVEEGYGV